LKKNQGNQSAGDRLPNAALCDSSMRALELARRLGLLAGDKTGTRARGSENSYIVHVDACSAMGWRASGGDHADSRTDPLRELKT
jgi:hypothetical protein